MFISILRLFLAVAFLCLPLAPAALADGRLKGRLVTMTVETYDTDGSTIFISKPYTVMVGDHVEFDMTPENGFQSVDVVPVRIEISDDRIELSYGELEGTFYSPAAFNGYVLRFEADCALFQSVTIDPTGTTLPLSADRVKTENGALMVNVAGFDFGPKSKIALDVQVADCLLG